MLWLAVAAALAAAGAAAAPALSPVATVAEGAAAPSHSVWIRGASSSASASAPASAAASLRCEDVADVGLYGLGQGDFVGAPGVSAASAAALDAVLSERSVLAGTARRANAFVYVAGAVAPSSSSSSSSSSALEPAGEVLSVSTTCCDAAAFTDDAVAMATTVARGVPSSAHGVVGSSWPLADGSVARAYGAGAWPDAARYPAAADSLLAASAHADGAAVVYAASGDRQLAGALAASPRTAAATGALKTGRAAAVSLDAKTLKLDSLYEDGTDDVVLPPAASLSRDAVLRDVQAPGLEPATNADDFAVAAEIALLRAVVADAIARSTAEEPVMVNFAFGSLRALADDPVKRDAALELIRTAAHEAVAALDAAFGGADAVDAQIFYADTGAVEAQAPETQDWESFRTSDADLAAKILKAAARKDASPQAVRRFFPRVYADRSGDNDALCTAITTALGGSGYEAKCSPAALPKATMKRSRNNNNAEDAPPAGSETSSQYTSEGGALLGDSDSDAQLVNIVAWTSLVLIIFIYMALYALCAMPEDPMLTRATAIRDKVRL